eukprot:TRINITY_DN4136_c0_g1_i1.p1 TRINITY_DN4136_c0_g1~~TRINITY_DN4136_c0_g1_i1.p1  ORF type:complete len:322 (-),score=47.02 TRINITY_DN4136_c0_g1_i1:31-996(-)
MMLRFLLAFALFVVVLASQTPVIGILGVPTAEGCVTLKEYNNHLKPQLLRANVAPNVTSCFTSYYVKWIEGGGGRVVPIRYDYSQTELKSLFSQLNGLLFTGGGLDLALNTPYVQTANYLFNLAKNQSDYFPVWGTCMGFQLLNILAAQDTGVLDSGFDSEDISWALNLTSKAPSSRFFQGFPSNIVKILTTENVTMNFHHDAVTPATYSSTPSLNTFYDVLSTNLDRQGREFISTIEAKLYPIYGTQWHPERQQYEFNSEDVGLVHTYDSIQANQAAAEFFVNEAKKSPHSFADLDQLDKMLIYNYAPYYTGESNQVYVF